MKSFTPIVIAFLLGAFAVSMGWGGLLYEAFLLIGLISFVVLAALVWHCLEQRNKDARAPTEGAPDSASSNAPAENEKPSLGK